MEKEGIIDNNSGLKADISGLPMRSDVKEFIMSLFEKWTEGPLGVSGQCSVGFHTSRKNFFPIDNYMCSLKIGVYITERFELQKFCFTWAMPSHSFHFEDKSVETAFYQKYPKEKISDQTVRELADMVYDLILIKNGHPFS